MNREGNFAYLKVLQFRFNSLEILSIFLFPKTRGTSHCENRSPELALRAASEMPPVKLGENVPSLISLQKGGPFIEDDQELHL